MLPICQALGYQALAVGKQGAASSIENALSMSAAYGLNWLQAVDEARRVAEVVAGWREHFAAAGVAPKVIAQLADFIDRPFLLEQRARLVAY